MPQKMGGGCQVDKKLYEGTLLKTDGHQLENLVAAWGEYTHRVETKGVIKVPVDLTMIHSDPWTTMLKESFCTGASIVVNRKLARGWGAAATLIKK